MPVSREESFLSNISIPDSCRRSVYQIRPLYIRELEPCVTCLGLHRCAKHLRMTFVLYMDMIFLYALDVSGQRTFLDICRYVSLAVVEYYSAKRRWCPVP